MVSREERKQNDVTRHSIATSIDDFSDVQTYLQRRGERFAYRVVHSVKNDRDDYGPIPSSLGAILSREWFGDF